MIDKRIQKKIRKLVKLVSKKQKDVSQQTYEVVDTNKKRSPDSNVPKRTVQLGYCYKGMRQYLAEQYLSGEINEEILDFLIEVNQNGKTVSG